MLKNVNSNFFLNFFLKKETDMITLGMMYGTSSGHKRSTDR